MGDQSGPGHGCTTSFTVLGHLAGTSSGRPLDLGPPKQRLLLAGLLCHSGSVVSTDRLTDLLWGDGAPRTARKNIQVYVAGLRRVVGDRISYRAPGYHIVIAEGELDLAAFDTAAAQGRRCLRRGDLEGARAHLDTALAWWQGRPLAEFSDNPAAVELTEGLRGRYVTAYEDWAEAKTELGDHLDVLETIDEVFAEFSDRERLAVLRMTALVGGGRPIEALAHYENVRRRMAQEFGMPPSAALMRLQRQVLDDLEQHSPAPRAESRPRPGMDHLPRDVPDFVGRAVALEALVADLTAAAPAHHVAVVTGPVAIGKTVFAVRAARRAGEFFPDGLLFGALEPSLPWAGPPDHRPAGWPRPTDPLTTSAVTARTLLAQVGFRLPADTPSTQVLATWRSWLATHTALAVLDGAPDEASVRALLPNGGRGRVLVTSTRRLSGLEGVLRVELGPLALEEALVLLRAVAGPWSPHEEPGARRLADLCGRVPLAVRIAAVKAVMAHSGGITRYAHQLAAPTSLFEELEIGDLSVRDRFDRCMAGLGEDCRRDLDLFSASGTAPVDGHRPGAFALPALRARMDRLWETNLLWAPSGRDGDDRGADGEEFSGWPATGPGLHRVAAEPDAVAGMRGHRAGAVGAGSRAVGAEAVEDSDPDDVVAHMAQPVHPAPEYYRLHPLWRRYLHERPHLGPTG